MKKTIGIRELHLECIIGCPGWERERKQRVIVEIQITVGEPADWLESDLLRTHCYAELEKQLRFVLENGRFILLENAAQFLAGLFLLTPVPQDPRPAVDEVAIRIVKPDILPGATAVAVGMTARRGDCPFVRQSENWGLRDIVAENSQTRLLRFTIQDGAELPQERPLDGFVCHDFPLAWRAVDGSSQFLRLVVAEF